MPIRIRKLVRNQSLKLKTKLSGVTNGSLNSKRKRRRIRKIIMCATLIGLGAGCLWYAHIPSRQLLSKAISKLLKSNSNPSDSTPVNKTKRQIIITTLLIALGICAQIIAASESSEVGVESIEVKVPIEETKEIKDIPFALQAGIMNFVAIFTFIVRVFGNPTFQRPPGQYI